VVQRHRRGGLSGNNGTANLYPPANDPFVITVGATNDKGTGGLADDVLAPFSAYGTDETGAVKPDLVAPGTNLISIVPKTKNKIGKITRAIASANRRRTNTICACPARRLRRRW